jgi:hypothetical protein
VDCTVRIFVCCLQKMLAVFPEELSSVVKVWKIVLYCRERGCTREEGVRLDISGREGEGLWGITPRSVVNRRFEESCHLRVQGLKISNAGETFIRQKRTCMYLGQRCVLFVYCGTDVYGDLGVCFREHYPLKDEAQTALFKDPVRTAL